MPGRWVDSVFLLMDSIGYSGYITINAYTASSRDVCCSDLATCNICNLRQVDWRSSDGLRSLDLLCTPMKSPSEAYNFAQDEPPDDLQQAWICGVQVFEVVSGIATFRPYTCTGSSKKEYSILSETDAPTLLVR